MMRQGSRILTALWHQMALEEASNAPMAPERFLCTPRCKVICSRLTLNKDFGYIVCTECCSRISGKSGIVIYCRFLCHTQIYRIQEKKNFFHQDIEQKDTKRPASYSLLFIAFIFVVNCISIYESLFLELFERFRSVTEKQTPSLNIKVFFFFLLLKVALMHSIYTWYYIFTLRNVTRLDISH